MYFTWPNREVYSAGAHLCQCFGQEYLGEMKTYRDDNLDRTVLRPCQTSFGNAKLIQRVPASFTLFLFLFHSLHRLGRNDCRAMQ